jgi:hypothetical protein
VPRSGTLGGRPAALFRFRSQRLEIINQFAVLHPHADRHQLDPSQTTGADATADSSHIDLVADAFPASAESAAQFRDRPSRPAAMDACRLGHSAFMTSSASSSALSFGPAQPRAVMAV